MGGGGFIGEKRFAAKTRGGEESVSLGGRVAMIRKDSRRSSGVRKDYDLQPGVSAFTRRRIVC